MNSDSKNLDDILYMYHFLKESDQKGEHNLRKNCDHLNTDRNCCVNKKCILMLLSKRVVLYMKCNSHRKVKELCMGEWVSRIDHLLRHIYYHLLHKLDKFLDLSIPSSLLDILRSLFPVKTIAEDSL